MNKRFSTLLAAVLVAGSFGSTYAQTLAQDADRKVEWANLKNGRAYYLAGINYVNPTNYLQAFTLNGIIDDENVSESQTQKTAQWTVETKKVGDVTQYAFKNIDGGQYLAFKKTDAGYVLAAKNDANDETKSFRWFTVVSETGKFENRLQAVLPSETEAYFLGVKNNSSWGPALLKEIEHDASGSTAVIKKNFALYEIYSDQVSAKEFTDRHGEDFTLEFPETTNGTEGLFENLTLVAVGTSVNDGLYLVDDNGTADDPDDDEYIVLSSTRLANTEFDDAVVGYRYVRMTEEEFTKAKNTDPKIADANRVFYAEESYNIGEDAYVFYQKGIQLPDVATTENEEVTFGEITNDETPRQLGSIRYGFKADVKILPVTVGKGTREEVKTVASERKLIVNVTGKVSDTKDKKVYALGLSKDYKSAAWYDKVSSADFDQPQGQWLVAGDPDNNTLTLINVQNPDYTLTGIKLYEAEGENTYTVFDADFTNNSDLASDAYDIATITLSKVADYDTLNGYYNKLSDVDQKFALVTSGEYANEGDEEVDLYLKAGEINTYATVVPHAGSEWELIRAEKADAVVVPSYSYYDTEEEAWVKMESKNLTTDLGTAADGADFPSDTLRLAYTYSVKSGDLNLGSGWQMKKDNIVFYLKENGEDTYSIVSSTSPATIPGFGKLNGINELCEGLTASEDFTVAVPFEIVDLDAAPSLAADSKHMTLDAANGTGFITTDENNSAILSQTSAALWVDSVNAEGYATPKFFVSLAGKMMTTGKNVEAAAKYAYDLDQITKDTFESIQENCSYNNVERVKFMTAERVAGEDTLMIGDEKYAGEDIDAFKFKITENENGEYILKNVTGGYVKVINGNLVLSDDVEDAEAFIIEQTDAPTANDEISTSEVKVIAGNGQITINGAAGKKVVVSNILGQVVANMVLTSDNATIAAPQGIVVIAVEGEEAVKAIVK